ncbi:uncharacterized protein LOC106174115 [Lingula anatina]|uniref:Uncharacterized protein LOC106174115 n=1 Tax=Lingula anatina TaxID=7574 RepID=A0A2R2MKY2_LINAN|nr:uncharacterized protein LOC106174115 [Lingula anatina]|eukprot:XP_023930722.1 uncharacterized protein LOC106174115 [Lingula anatina]
MTDTLSMMALKRKKKLLILPSSFQRGKMSSGMATKNDDFITFMREVKRYIQYGRPRDFLEDPKELRKIRESAQTHVLDDEECRRYPSRSWTEQYRQHTLRVV